MHMKDLRMHMVPVFSVLLVLSSCRGDQSRGPETTIIEVKEGIPPAGIQYKYGHSQANKKGMWVKYKVVEAGTSYDIKIAVAANEGESTWYEIRDSRIELPQLQMVNKYGNVEKSFLYNGKTFIKQNIVVLSESTDSEPPTDGKVYKAQKTVNNKTISTTVVQSVTETPTGEEKKIRFEWSEQVPGLFLFSKFGGLVASTNGRQVMLEDFGTDAQPIQPPVEKDNPR